MHQKIAVMKNLLEKKFFSEGVQLTGVKDMALFRTDKPYKKKPELYQPHIMFLAQGKKKIYLGDRTYIFDPYNYFVQTVPLAVDCEAVIEKNNPILGIVLRINPSVVGEILFESQEASPPEKQIFNSLYNASVTDTILDAVIRLLETLDSEGETKVLGPIFYKEILFRILKGENGGILSELAVNNRGFYHISRVINKLHENYSQPVEIQSLAKEAGMSINSFHSNFKAMTNTSPLQYVKNIRLHKAKEMIQQEGEMANIAARKVGYESSSQFSREYKRCFGNPPSKDRLSANF